MRFLHLVAATLLGAGCWTPRPVAPPPPQDVNARSVEVARSELGPQPSSPAAPESCDVIRRVGVASTALRSVGYCREQRILEIQFVRGGIYRYYDVPPRIYRDLMAAASHGRYFNYVVKRRYAYRRMR
jgi:hypothetical protein